MIYQTIFAKDAKQAIQLVHNARVNLGLSRSTIVVPFTNKEEIPTFVNTLNHDHKYKITYEEDHFVIDPLKK